MDINGNINCLEIGSVLISKQNRYTLQGVIGQGGFGIVYKATDQQNELVAVKEYFPNGLASRAKNRSTVISINEEENHYFYEGVKHFYNEAKIMKYFQDDNNIVHIKDFF